MFKIGRDHWRSLRPISLWQDGLIEYLIQDCVQMAFKYPAVRETPKPLRAIFPVLSHSHSEVLPHVQVELPVCQFLPVAWHHQEQPGSFLLAFSLPILPIYWWGPLLAVSSQGWTVPAPSAFHVREILQPPKNLRSPLLALPQEFQSLLCQGFHRK